MAETYECMNVHSIRLILPCLFNIPWKRRSLSTNSDQPVWNPTYKLQNQSGMQMSDLLSSAITAASHRIHR
jgi:hypothetical protein